MDVGLAAEDGPLDYATGGRVIAPARTARTGNYIELCLRAETRA